MKRFTALTMLLLIGLSAGCRAPLPSMKGVFAPYGTTKVAPPSTSSYGTAGADTYYQPRQSSLTPSSGKDRSNSDASGTDEPGTPSVLVQNSQLRSETNAAHGSPARRLVVGRGIADTPSGASQTDENASSQSDVMQASFEQLVSDTGDGRSNVSEAEQEVAVSASDKWVVTETPIRIEEAPAAALTETIALGGMPVRDATVAASAAGSTQIRANGKRANGEPELFVPQGRLIELAELPDAPDELLKVAR